MVKLNKPEIKRGHVKIGVFGVLHTNVVFHKHKHTNSTIKGKIKHACKIWKQQKFLLALNFAFQKFKPKHKSWVVTNLPPLK